MAQFLAPDEVWREIRKQAKRSHSLRAVVGYLGRAAFRALPRWPSSVVIVADLSEESVRSGLCSAKAARQLLRKARVDVRSLPGLHAKIYLFGRAVVVGSANLSEASQRSLEEAAVLLTTPSELKSVRRYVGDVVNRAAPLDDKILTALARREPKRAPRAGQRRRPRRGFEWGDRVWVLRTASDDKETKRERASKRAWQEEEAAPVRVDWWNNAGKRTFQRLKPGHTVFSWWEPTGRRPNGSLEGPFEVIHPVDLGPKFGDRRYCIAILSRGRRTTTLDSRTQRTLLGATGRPQSEQFDEVPDLSEVRPNRLTGFARLARIKLRGRRDGRQV